MGLYDTDLGTAMILDALRPYVGPPLLRIRRRPAFAFEMIAESRAFQWCDANNQSTKLLTNSKQIEANTALKT